MSWNWFWPSKCADLYIDLGTANTLVVDRKRGLVANEPSVIAYREIRGKKIVVSVGSQAWSNIGRTPENFHTCFPLREGVIADLDTTESMLRYFFNKAKRSSSLLRPTTVISLPHGVSAVERKAVREAGITAGAREVILVEEPILAAIGADLPVHAPQGNMIIDMGAGTTEIAVISLNDIVHCESIRVGGNSLDRAILEFIKNQYNLIIGEPSAEKLKIEIASSLCGSPPRAAKIRGLDFGSNLPKEIAITSSDLFAAVNLPLMQILEATRKTLEAIPPELVPDIASQGLHIVGGGALLQGLSARFQQELKIPVSIPVDPLSAVARGGQQILKSMRFLEAIRVA